jgi:AAA domain
MAITRGRQSKKKLHRLKTPKDEALRAAKRLQVEQTRSRRPIPAEARTLSARRSRRFGRRVLAEGERLSLGVEWIRHAALAPKHRVGRFIVRLRLTLSGFANAQLLAALAALALAALWRFVVRPADGSIGYVISSALFGATLIGAVVAVWNDFVRCPWIARRIRRRIARRPECVLPTTSPYRQAELSARDEDLPIVPREDLFDEVLPGIFDRHRSDIQIVVGEPGAGKTTALVGLAERLARMGIVPVVVPMWGSTPENDLIEAAEKRFKRNAASLLGTDAHLDAVWRWLRSRQRVVVAVDDLDRIPPDGERGFLLRRALDELAGENLAAVVTTRPAGIPAGLAASAINLSQLDGTAAVDHVLEVAGAEPGAVAKGPPSAKVRGNVAQWVQEGDFAEVPFYLELLARLVAVGRCEELPPADAVLKEAGDVGRVREREDGRCEWNPLWVRFRLLECFYDEIAEGRVYQWLAIERRERDCCLTALSGASLATLAAAAVQARGSVAVDAGEAPDVAPARRRIEDFLDSDDRDRFSAGLRAAVSAHEVVDSGERLKILDRDPSGELHFHHRIMQAYLAGRCLAKKGEAACKPVDSDWFAAERPDWIGMLLEPSHPERLTAQMALTFAAMRASEEKRRNGDAASGLLIESILDRLIAEADNQLPGRKSTRGDGSQPDERDGEMRLDPRQPFHPEADRADPDDALAKLTTAAEIARATDVREGFVGRIVERVREAEGATMWTKLSSIPSVAALKVRAGWECVWEFARDADQEVRRAASEAIAEDAFAAYSALEAPIEVLLARAELRSRYGLTLDSPSTAERDGRAIAASRPRGEVVADGAIEDDPVWDARSDVPSLRALGWILPAMVSGLREHLGAHYVKGARQALEHLVVLAFQGGHPELEASLAQGFKSDAMRHADDPDASGPGFVANNRRLVTDFCIDNADYWYARLVLHQALALYTIAGSSRRVAFDIFGRQLHGNREPHPFVWRAARLARRAVRRHSIGSRGWESLIWVDEGVAVSRRPTELSFRAAQLVADITLLLNLREGAAEDRQAHFPYMRELPRCLHESPERREILGAGCPDSCGYGLCPLKQPPPDEPNGQRTVSRAFCRGQYALAAHHKPPWQKRHIRKRALQKFWHQMERRART